MERERITVSGRIFAAIVAAGRAAGADADAVLARLGIDPASFADADARLPLSLEDALWDAMATASGDPCFGLDAGRRAVSKDWDVFGYALRTSATLREVMLNVARYNRLVHDVAVITIEEEPERTRIIHRFPGDPRGASRHAADYTLAAIVTVARALTGLDIAPSAVTRAHGPPADDRCYKEVFGARALLTHGGPHNEIAFSRDAMSRPVVSADPPLHAVLRRHADDLLARLPAHDDLVTEVRRGLADALRGGDPSLDAVAKKLARSPRTLQRRLSELGIRYQDLLDEMRRELGFAYLRDPRTAIPEVAYLLGFSEPRAFHRAFKRWTGTTPAAWRRPA